jgi:hypothetical protein
VRELGFAIAGAAALIVLGLWALGQSDNQQWSDATQLIETSRQEHGGAVAADTIAPRSARLLNQAPAVQSGSLDSATPAKN